MSGPFKKPTGFETSGINHRSFAAPRHDVWSAEPNLLRTTETTTFSATSGAS